MLFLVVFILAIALATIGLVWVNARFVSANQGGVDFFVQYHTAQSWAIHGTSPYSDTIAQETYRIVQGKEPIPAFKANQVAFLSPLYAMAIQAPLGAGDPQTSRIIWMTLTEICLVVTAILALNLTGWKVSAIEAGFVFLYALLGYYSMRTILQGSFSAITAMLLLGGLVLIQGKRDMDAGLVLALATMDLHLSLPLVIFAFFWSLSVGRGRIALGLIIGGAFLTVSSMVFLPDWPIQWVRGLFQYLPAILDRTSVITTLSNQMPGISSPLGLVLYGAAALYLIGEWILAWGRSDRWFQWTALLTLVLTVVFPLRVTSADFVVLIPVLFLLFRSWQERWGAGGQRAAWVLLGVVTIGFWTLFLLTVQHTREFPLMQILPPFLCLGCLWWVRWWAIHRQRLFYEEYPV
jgi:hypothetical protein